MNGSTKCKRLERCLRYKGTNRVYYPRRKEEEEAKRRGNSHFR
jgi:hypothetical protein